ncbi:MAG TPA: hypothetical protein VGE46_01675, partial [Bdellovibrio sp.]
MRMMALGAVLFFSHVVFAGLGMGGDHSGNGGQTVVCRDSQKQITSIEVLDSFEGRKLNNMQVQLGATDLTFEQKADLAIQRLNSLNPTRAKLYAKWRAGFFNGVTFV